MLNHIQPFIGSFGRGCVTLLCLSTTNTNKIVINAIHLFRNISYYFIHIFMWAWNFWDKALSTVCQSKFTHILQTDLWFFQNKTKTKKIKNFKPFQRKWISLDHACKRYENKVWQVLSLCAPENSLRIWNIHLFSLWGLGACIQLIRLYDEIIFQADIFCWFFLQMTSVFFFRCLSTETDINIVKFKYMYTHTNKI